ncbi:MNIO family bufferin maturase [Marinobacterium jannaschii]|uniref:MNIO family bufferin maturase n=1 Tax=Marinobacterium jannaschii TaxID=64970 RepID=UPI000486B1C0|nr:DUF692 domain-containing protein [Marinobacterium jannaschii]
MQNRIEGVGLGLRSCHYQHILSHKPRVPWFEVMTDNYMGAGGQPHQYLEQIRQRYPVTFHGVGLSLGSAAPLNKEYLHRLKELVDIYQPAWVSEHLCWCASDEYNSHELLPLPYTELCARHLAERIDQVQNCLGQRLVVENLSSYVTFAESEMSEWEFVSLICQLADCDLLLDVNNVYVSATNHGFSAADYISGVPAKRVREIHLAGFEDQGDLLLDSHSRPVYDAVWDLYRQALERVGPVPTLIEWDNDIPGFEVLEAEAEKARAIAAQTAGEVSCAG